LKRSGLAIVPAHEVDNITHAMSMIASTGAVALLNAVGRALAQPNGRMGV
jgi:LysR family transcriptional regulator, hca operon transcriptional activator